MAPFIRVWPFLQVEMLEVQCMKDTTRGRRVVMELRAMPGWSAYVQLAHLSLLLRCFASIRSSPCPVILRPCTSWAKSLRLELRHLLIHPALLCTLSLLALARLSIAWLLQLRHLIIHPALLCTLLLPALACLSIARLLQLCHLLIHPILRPLHALSMQVL